MKKRSWLLIAISASLSACAYVAINTAPPKQASNTRSEAALAADTLFWEALHSGDYEKIPTVLEAMTGAYLANPNDAVTAAHVGWLHIWRLAERARLSKVPATITDDAVMARKYFQEAVTLNPEEPRYLGFLASSLLAEGNIHKDEKLLRQGYFTMLDAIDGWPEFNLFTAGYVMSGSPAGSERFNKALAWQWQNLDVCVAGKVDRGNPDYGPYMPLLTSVGKNRVCWNSWTAPHNFEGFFLNMGDMLVKAGDWQTAQKIYANAKLSADYAHWKFSEVLELRIAQAQTNVAEFNKPQGQAKPPMMFDSSFGCMACHQR